MTTGTESHGLRVSRRRAMQYGAMTGVALAAPGSAVFAGPAEGAGQSVPPRDFAPPEKGARLFEDAWHFHRGDVPMPKLLGHRVSYEATKAGGAVGAAAAVYDDGDWPLVELPHDWAAAEVPNAEENIAQGYRARGISWYRRGFRLDETLRGRYLELQFGAISSKATVWFNGIETAHSWSGYSAIHIDLTANAYFGDALNSIAVRVDAEQFEGWWYEGAGPYRHVWLVDRAPVHIVTDGIHADPRLQANGGWSVPVEATLYSIEEKDASVRVVAELLDDRDAVIASASTQVTVSPLARAVARLEITDVSPRLWSVDAPNLYRVRTRVSRAGQTVDERITPCGFRTLHFDPDKGLLINGEHVKIKGVCVHGGHAGVGVAVPDSLIWWRVQQLKRMGCNAIRTAHNAPSPALLDACDRLGLLVMDENRLFNVSPDYIEQLQWLVRRDRNHPSVILWSVFNEEPMEGTSSGYEMVRRASAAVKALDTSRPVTAAMSGGLFAPVNVSQAVDVVGFNYHQYDYDKFHDLHPDWPITSSEDTSAFMVRGEWFTDEDAHVKSADDTEHALWGNSHRQAWKEIATRPFVAGAFVWTGFDYYGEPTPYTWPTKSSLFGSMDLCGFPKAAFYIHQAQWLDRPVLKILPHWNWKPGTPIKVLVATQLDQVVLTLNGKTVADGPADPYQMFSADLQFAPGRLEAHGYRNGKLVATDAVETTGTPVRLRLTPDRSRLRGDGADAVPVTIEALDSRGRPVPTADMRVDLSVSGARLIGVGNGNPNAGFSGKESHVPLFNGLAQAIIQTERGSQGRASLSASAAGLAPASTILSVAAVSVPSVAPGPLRFMIQGWRQSPVVQEKPGQPGTLADNDMNSWQRVRAGTPPPFSGTTGYLTLAAQIEVPGNVTRNGGLIVLQTVNGAGSLWLNGEQKAEKTYVEAGAMKAAIPPGLTKLDVALILKVLPDQRTGLPGLVFLESEAH
ncbi:beta-galactosidase GalA [Novosphingobium album (ex Hu et al. 2023)]|uniref:DUF4982 domain-containing protein n=1 Tax=Novosphingobium album (ex Hu et al. 2023) TaxID=2930093 RepID=A0ABT0B573_9SPHN|nr:beta-galactosidase GalA [Novosphingobium album (ex Hu et al. 2023)]MCJ2180237.1 DUF4982 domain-containing protein [Novosphingobium album (ex Hu et al. 2023)]